MANPKVVELIKNFASQGLKPSEIAEELKTRRMKATKNQIAYYVYRQPSTSTGTKSAKLAKGSDFQRALKVLEADVLTADEKVSIATMILKAKPTA